MVCLTCVQINLCSALFIHDARTIEGDATFAPEAMFSATVLYSYLTSFRRVIGVLPSDPMCDSLPDLACNCTRSGVTGVQHA